MSNETMSTTQTVGNDETKPTTTMNNNESMEASSTNGSLHSNGTNQNEQQQQQQQKVEPVESTNNNDGQETYNKNELEPEFLRKVFIGGLSYKTDEEAFKSYFANYGDIVDCIIMRDRDGRSRGFGFVTYASSAMVDLLMAGRPHVLDTREIEPKRALPREESGKPEASLSAKKLFVGGIREGTIDEHDLKEYFAKYGNIVDAVIMKTNEGKLRGFGFVEFDDYDPVDKIVLEKHHIIKGNAVNVEKALPKDQTNRARQAAANYGGQGGRGGGGMRGPSSRSSGGWGPMGGQSNFGGVGGGGGGYRSGGSGGGYGGGDDYGNRSSGYGGGFGGDMGGGGGMMGFGGSAPMGGGGGDGYGMSGPARGGFDDGYGAFGAPSNFGFGQSYGTSSGGGPMRRGGGGGGRGGGPYNRGGGGGGGGGGRGGGNYRGRN